MINYTDMFLKDGCTEKKSATDELQKRGGLCGVAHTQLYDELAKAICDKTHLFHEAALALQKNNFKEYSYLFVAALLKIPDGSPLSLLKLIYYTMPMITIMTQNAESCFLSGTEHEIEHYPQEIREWGAIGAGIKLASKGRTTKATEQKTLYSKDEKNNWKELAKKIGPEFKNKLSISKEIARIRKLPKEAIETIRKTI